MLLKIVAFMDDQQRRVKDLDDIRGLLVQYEADSERLVSDVSFRALRPAKPHENDSELRWWRRLERRDRRHNGNIEAVDVSDPERAC
jgi:hypothetical protein